MPRAKLSMKNTFGTVLLCAWVFAVCYSAEGQQLKKLPRIGVVGGSSAAGVSARIEAFRDGLRELGYVEGKNIFVDYRYADGKSDRLPALVAELVALNPDV